jgi:hypothetical protein
MTVYGLINEAMRRHVVENAGNDVWAQVAALAGTSQSFAAMHYYDDADTYALVAAASEVLGQPADVLLRGFGRYWALRVGPENYAGLLGATGTDVVSVLRNLDAMHSRLMSLYPDLRPPSISLTVTGESTFDVFYRSDRTGLVPFVVGILEGLGVLYETPAEVSHDSAASAGTDHEVFHVRLAGAGAS